MALRLQCHQLKLAALALVIWSYLAACYQFGWGRSGNMLAGGKLLCWPNAHLLVKHELLVKRNLLAKRNLLVLKSKWPSFFHFSFEGTEHDGALSIS